MTNSHRYYAHLMISQILQSLRSRETRLQGYPIDGARVPVRSHIVRDHEELGRKLTRVCERALKGSKIDECTTALIHGETNTLNLSFFSFILSGLHQCHRLHCIAFPIHPHHKMVPRSSKTKCDHLASIVKKRRPADERVIVPLLPFWGGRLQ